MYIIFRGIYDKARMVLKWFYFLDAISILLREWGYLECGDGSDELYCNGKCTKILQYSIKRILVE